MSCWSITILAHGAQTRLASLNGQPKHLLRLEQCGEWLLPRTLRLISEIASENADGYGVRLVAGFAIRGQLARAGERENGWNQLGHRYSIAPGWWNYMNFQILSFDENQASAPKCTLERLEQVFAMPRAPRYERNLLLLGDVVWSRHALTQVLTDTRPVMFAGTPDLSTSGGELFAIGWDGDQDDQIQADLAATERSAHRDVPQPGQLRRLLWHRRGNKLSPVDDPQYLSIDDWTNDIDTDGDLLLLPALDHLAAMEEQEHQRRRLDLISHP